MRFGTFVKWSDNLFTQNLKKNIVNSSGSQFLQFCTWIVPMVTFFLLSISPKNTMPDTVSTSFTDTEIQTVHCVQVSIGAPLLLFLFLLLLQVSQSQHHSWWFRNKVQILYGECQTMTYSLADWQLKTKMDWNNSTLAGKVNSLKQRLQFKVHEMVNNTERSVFSPLTLLQWSTFSPLLIITFQSLLPVHLVLDLFVLQDCCCRHFHSICCSCPDPQGAPSLQHAPTTSLFEFCILLHAQTPP